jgi:hypothetical protein
LEHVVFSEWLKVKHDIPFYTPLPIPDCPDNVVYPMEEVLADVVPNFKRTGGGRIDYITSGPAAAIALAIHLGYKRIEMWGIEMESNAEYIYQRDAIGLYFGIALGRGIEVVIPEDSVMFYAPLYGYTASVGLLDREAFEQRATELAQIMEKTFQDFNQAKGRLEIMTKHLVEEQAAGASQEKMNELGKEFQAAQNLYEQALANHAHVNGQYFATRAFQVRAEKELEYECHAQEILAQRDDKWNRITDKIGNRDGKVMLPNESPA